MSSLQGPPYRPSAQGLGGTPTVRLDVPITAVFLFLFIVGGAAHFATFKINMRAGRKFAPSAMLFAWAFYPRNIRLAMAAGMFIYAGTIIIFLIDLLFAQRIVRAQHGRFGWSKPFKGFLIFTVAAIGVSFIMLITTLVQSFYTLNGYTHYIDRSIMLYGTTFFAVVAFMPIIFIVFSCIIPHKGAVDHFGSGRFRTKIAITLAASVLMSAGTAFRAATNWVAPTPVDLSTTPWYLTKSCFYIFNFGLEILVLYFFLAVRIDRRFIIPNGAHGPGSYSINPMYKAGDAYGIDFTTTSKEKTWNNRDSMRNLHDPNASRTSIGSRYSYSRPGSSRYSNRNSTVSWGGHGNDSMVFGELEEMGDRIPGENETELGFDPKSGKWKLRPVSTYSGVSGVTGVSVREHV
ncbi:hypothetical protein B0A49_08409 [Cryomyces minteri]|uniref:Uncharacterized protein n=1 Tax=Cryomyces minteri TaxID=331657 RepID=A0A4U0WJV1_9PEZI|nr:hypothetical protein B0A49_08409 [Cryomyces minteri]